MTTLTTNAPIRTRSSFLDTLRASMRRRATYARVLGELSAMSDRDLADIGISRHSIRDVAADAARRI